jgi:hypothetical protein
MSKKMGIHALLLARVAGACSLCLANNAEEANKSNNR